MEEEIKKLQLERGKLEGRLVGFSDIGAFDPHLYSNSLEEYDTSIAVTEEDVEEEEQKEINIKFDHSQESKRKFLNSFSGPTSIIEDIRKSKEDFDPMKETKRKKISEKEDEYRARWRKRKLSPPRIDAFSTDSNMEPEKYATRYKDVMIDVQLEKERAELLRKIEEKKKEEKKEKEKEEKKRKKEIKKILKKEKKKSKWSSDEEEESNEKKKKKKKKEKQEWKLIIFKKGAIINTISISPDLGAYNFGRNENAEIRLDHLSCSKNHAKLSFISGSPSIMDLNSTNGTILNDKEITPGQWHKLSNGDILKFGCSTREYHIKTY